MMTPQNQAAPQMPTEMPLLVSDMHSKATDQEIPDAESVDELQDTAKDINQEIGPGDAVIREGALGTKTTGIGGAGYKPGTKLPGTSGASGQPKADSLGQRFKEHDMSVMKTARLQGFLQGYTEKTAGPRTVITSIPAGMMKRYRTRRYQPTRGDALIAKMEAANRKGVYTKPLKKMKIQKAQPVKPLDIDAVEKERPVKKSVPSRSQVRTIPE